MKNKVLLFYFENTLVDYKDHFGRYFEEVVKHRKRILVLKNILLNIYIGCGRLKHFILKMNYEIVKTHFKCFKNFYLLNILTYVSSNH